MNTYRIDYYKTKKEYIYRIFLKNDKVDGINYGYDVYAKTLKSALNKLDTYYNKIETYYKFEV